MKLYVYDHCPYCVRARMPFGLKNIPFEMVILANDDEATPLSMIGKKMLPILEDAAGFIGESLDIVKKLDSLADPRLFDGPPSSAITTWLEKWSSVKNGLVIPRTPDPVYPEFRTESARAYFTAKKEVTFGRFEELLAQTDSFKAELAQGLAELVPILPDPEGASIDDILLFPTLRSLTIMPDLELPKSVAAYAERMSERTGIPLVGTLRASMNSTR